MAKRTHKKIVAGWINLTTACNNHCHFCFREGDLDSPTRTIEMGTASRIVDLYAKLKIEKIGFIGGEPTLFEALPTLAKQSMEAGIREVHLISNGRRLADEDYLEKLVPWVGGFNLSLYSSDKECHNAVTQADSWSETALGIKNVLKVNRFCAVNVVVNNRNMDNAYETVKELLSWDVHQVMLTSAKPRLINGQIEGSEALDPLDYARLVEKCASIEDRRLSITYKRPFCLLDGGVFAQLAATLRLGIGCEILSQSTIVVDVDGNLIPCNTITNPYLNLANEDAFDRPIDEFLDIRKDRLTKVRKNLFPRRKPSACQECVFRKFCDLGCPLVWKYYNLEDKIRPIK